MTRTVLQRIGDRLPPPESEYAETRGGFTCGNCDYGKNGGRTCTYPRWGAEPPFSVRPDGCCRNFENTSMKAVGSPEGFPMPGLPLSGRASAEGPLGNVGTRERKPTEAHLDRLIETYSMQYVDATRNAAESAVRVLREGGKLAVRLPEAREAYLNELLPILDQLDAVVADAVRLGAARRWDPTERGDDIERLVALIVPQVRRRREYWLRKMATDFVRTVVLRILEPEPEDAEPRVAGHEIPGFAAAPIGPLKPLSFEVSQPDKEYEFPQDLLDELLDRGYTFGKVRAIEATHHDVWHGDDLGYVTASREDGVQEFVWRTSEDPLVCPICDELDGSSLTPAEAESVARDRPEWSHCSCRCFIEAIGPTESLMAT